MGLTVAIIEPDTTVASHVEQAFTKLGFEAHVLGDGDAFEFVRTKTPSVVLLNVELPRGSGYSLCNRLKKQADLKRIPIILTSGRETAEAFAQHQRSVTHADAYMHKPFSVDQLVDAVGKLIPEAFPNGVPQVSARSFGNASTGGVLIQNGASGETSAPDAATPKDAGAESDLAGGSGEGLIMPGPSTAEPRRDKPSGALPGAQSAVGESSTFTRAADASRGGKQSAVGKAPAFTRAADASPGGKSDGRPRHSGAGPSLDELLALGRTEAPQQPPPNAAGHEAKIAFLRDTLRQKEQEIARAGELWSERDREMSQLTEVLELRERELERARKAREDLLAQLTTAEDKVAALHLDVELGTERAERLEREKKALADELENTTDELERNVSQLHSRGRQLEEALKLEQASRLKDNERSATEIRDLVNDLDGVRAALAKREAELHESDVRARTQATELQGKVAGLQADIGNFKGKLIDAAKDDEALKRELNHVRADKSSHEARARALVEELEGKMRDLSLDKDGVDAELSRVVAELAESDARLSEASARVTDLEADLAETHGHLADTSSQLEHSQTRALELHNEVAEAQQHGLALSQTQQRLEAKLVESRREGAQTAERLGGVTSDFEEVKQKAAAQARDFEARSQAFKERLAVLEDKGRASASQLAQLEAQLTDTVLRLDEKQHDWDQERINRQKDVLKRDQRIGDLEQKNRALDGQVHESERAGKQREAELSHDLDSQRARGDELDRDVNRVRAKGIELEALLEDAKGKLGESSKELKRAAAKIAVLTDENAVATERSDELSRLLDEQKERTAFAEAELAEERANHQQDMQSHVGALDRTSLQAKERIEKLQDSLARMKAELAASQADTAATKERLTRAEDKSAKLEATLGREQRDRQQLVDRHSVLDEEVEGAQAKAEALTDEITRLKASLKRAQEEALAVKKERGQLEERLKIEENTMVKRVEDVKHSAMAAQGKVRDDVERLTNERDTARAQGLDIRRKAEALMAKYRALEASISEKASSADPRVGRLGDELRAEKEARARESANAKALEEKLRAQMATLSTQALEANDVEMVALKTQVKDKDERLQKAVAEYNAMRERARDALAKLKTMNEKATTGGGAELKGRVEQLTGKYNEVVTKLKQQAELNKKFDAAYKELAEKHRKALIMLKEHREQAADESTQIVKVPLED